MAVAVENNADLIVMGRYRHTALLEGLLGSTIDRVLRGTQIPVLIALAIQQARSGSRWA
jgi:nucleotide-binding universal stress UspA family protein